MKRPTIMIDMDGVLCDFVEAFTRTARELDPTQVIITTEKQATWNLVGLMDRRLMNQTWDRVRATHEWWYKMPYPMINRRELQDLLQLTYSSDVVFCTNRSAATPGRPIAAQTAEWLEDRGIYHPSVLCARDKGLVAMGIEATHAIDDRAENCQSIALMQPQCSVYLLDRPYNRDAVMLPNMQRVASFEEFLSCFAALDKQSIAA